MPKRIRIQIHPDGRVEAETLGITGPSCTGYIHLIEEMLSAEATSSYYKPEYAAGEHLVETRDERLTVEQQQSLKQKAGS